ncbi:MAG TPA: PPK2 family polyphosphate kinase [Saprospiraceae bacterium]|nr:PPK2 family polyphosphate kinase [Saprospiraceae bacterium]
MSKIILSKIPTRPPKNADKKTIKKKTEELAEKIGLYCEMLYAEKKNSLLVVLQGMDASGKDGVAKSVFKFCPALNIDAHAFKKPTEEEMAHDFLWRVHKYAPAKGQIKLFIRSHYEDILIQRVHQWIDDEKAARRMEAINDFEKLLQESNGTTILKFYLHLSHERQLEKLEERKIEPDKQWKYNAQDFEESKLWDKYMRYYEAAFNGSALPWHIVPSDTRWYRNYFVAQVVHETLKNLKPSFPLLLDDGKNKD